MGGFGATKMAVRHADVFADASVFVGGEEGDANVGNLQDTPLLLGASAADADAGGAAASVLYEQLRMLGDEAHVKQYLAGTHEPAIIDLAVPQMVPQWRRAVRPAVPARVRYGFDTSWDFGALTDDGSAWLQDLRPSAGATQGTGSAEALTLPRTLTALTETPSTGGSPADRSIYVLRDSLRHPTGARAVSNALTLSLAGVRSATIDLAALRVDTSRRYCLDITGDSPAAVRLTGLRLSGLAVTGVPAARSGGDLVLQPPAGTTHAVLAPRGVPAGLGTPCPAAAVHASTAVRASTAGPAAPAAGSAESGPASVPGSAGPSTTGTIGTRSSALPTTGLGLLAPVSGAALLALALSLVWRRRA